MNDHDHDYTTSAAATRRARLRRRRGAREEMMVSVGGVGGISEFLVVLQTQISNWLPRLAQLQMSDAVTSYLLNGGVARDRSSLYTTTNNDDGDLMATSLEGRSVQLINPSSPLSNEHGDDGGGDGDSTNDFVIMVSNRGVCEATIAGCFRGTLVKCHITMPPKPAILINPMTASLDSVPGFSKTSPHCDVRTLLTAHYKQLQAERTLLGKIIISLMGLIFGTQDILNIRKGTPPIPCRGGVVVASVPAVGKSRVSSRSPPSFPSHFHHRPYARHDVHASKSKGLSSPSSSSSLLILQKNNVSFTGISEVKMIMKKLAEEVSPLLKTYRNRVTEFSQIYFGGGGDGGCGLLGTSLSSSPLYLDQTPLTLQTSKTLFLLYTTANMATLTDLGKPLEKFYVRNLTNVGLPKSLSCEVYMKDVSDASLILLNLPREPDRHHHRDEMLELEVTEYCLNYDNGLVKCILFESPRVKVNTLDHDSAINAPAATQFTSEETLLMNKLEASYLFLSLSLCVTCQDFKGLITCRKTLTYLEDLTHVRIDGKVSSDDTIFLTTQQVRTLCHTAAALWKTCFVF